MRSKIGRITAFQLSELKIESNKLIDIYKQLYDENIEKSVNDLVGSYVSPIKYDDIGSFVDHYYQDRTNPKSLRKRLMKTYRSYISSNYKGSVLNMNKALINTISFAQVLDNALEEAGYNSAERKKKIEDFVRSELLPKKRRIVKTKAMTRYLRKPLF